MAQRPSVLGRRRIWDRSRPTHATEACHAACRGQAVRHRARWAERPLGANCRTSRWPNILGRPKPLRCSQGCAVHE